MTRPLFSCVVPVKGPRPYLAEALASLRGQGLGDDLEILVQDGDAEPDAGQSDALNRGFAKARGAWLFWLNADDLILPGALRKVASLIDRSRPEAGAGRGENPGPLDWVVGNELFVDAAGHQVGCSVGCVWHDWLFRHAVPHVNGPSAFFRRELFARVGAFDVTLHFCMDWDLWIRFMKVGARYARLDDFLWAQRRWTGSKTQRALSADEWTLQQAEVGRMLRKNGFEITSAGCWGERLWKALNGVYLRQLVENVRHGGRRL